MTPKLSVLITCHNDGPTLQQSVESMLQQTEPNIEIQVLNNGSTDETQAVLERLAADDSRVVGHRFPLGMSHPEAINWLAGFAAAPWLLVHNADDWADIGYVAAILKAAEDSTVNCIFSPWQWEGARHDVQVFPAYHPATMIDVHQVPGIRAVRRDLWDRTGGEDASIPVGSDWDWAVRASRLGLVPYQLSKPHLHVRAQGDGQRLSDGWLAVRDRVRSHMRAHQFAPTC